MRQQSHAHTCGAVALCNAAEALGIRLTEEKAIKLAGTDPITGTSPAGMKKALKQLRLVPEDFSHKHPGIAFLTLSGAVVNGNPVLMTVDDDEHWIVAIGVLGPRIVVADSADPGTVAVLSPAMLMKRWRADTCYGIVVGTR